MPFQSWNLKLLSRDSQDYDLLDSSLAQDNHSFIIEANSLEFTTIPNNIDWQRLFIDNNLFSDFNQDLSYLVATDKFSLASLKEQETLINIPLEFSSDLWEAEVITVGYVKNILEIILEFFDKIAWWIEQQILMVWQFFKKILSIIKRAFNFIY